MISPNQKEIDFLQSKDKADEYMTHLQSLQFDGEVTVFDVGANVGMFSISISNHFGNDANVYAFEPFKELYDSLIKNTENLRVKHVNKAVMTKNEPIKGCYLPNYTLLSGFYVDQSDKENLELLANKSLDSEFTMIEEIVDAIRLDTFMEQNQIDKIDILKIDVEKAELNVLQSLGTRLENVKCVVAEVHEVNIEKFVEILRQQFKNVCIGEKDLPKFCLNDEQPSEWISELNTYIVFAYN
jgi:FkbM family methyltransferase